MRLLILLFAIVAGAAPAHAADLTGHWRMTAEGRTALALSLAKAPDGSWTGTISRPAGMSIDNGTSVSDLTGTPSSRTLVGTAATGDRAELRLEPATGGEAQVRFAVTRLGDDHAELRISAGGQQTSPISLVRSASPAPVAAGWESRSYRIDPSWPDNAEMAAMFEADQAARTGGPIDWTKLAPEDARRRARTAALIAAGKLRSANDYYSAAFIFQHGDQASDYLLAHTFAVIAAARGRADATWIAAATLDRYLQKIGQPQVYGTQFFTRPNEPVTQEPYNRTLVSDALRSELGVPPQATQDQRRQAMQDSRDAAAKSRSK